MRHLLRDLSPEELEAASPPPASTCLINRSSGVEEAASSASGAFFARSADVQHPAHVARACDSAITRCTGIAPGNVPCVAHTAGAKECARVRLAPGSRVVIRRYATRARGVVEICDLEQEAALTALEVERRPDIRDRDSYETRAVALALLRLVAEMRAPVSLPKDMGDTWEEAAASKRLGVVRVSGSDESFDVVLEDRNELAQVAAEAFEPAEDVLDRERVLEQIRAAMATESEAARAVLLEGEKSATVAQRLGMTVRQVYDRTAEAMERLRAALRPLADRV